MNLVLLCTTKGQFEFLHCFIHIASSVECAPIPLFVLFIFCLPFAWHNFIFYHLIVFYFKCRLLQSVLMHSSNARNKHFKESVRGSVKVPLFMYNILCI